MESSRSWETYSKGVYAAIDPGREHEKDIWPPQVDRLFVKRHWIYSRVLSRVPYQSTFPLSSDHLLPLVQYNLVRASMTNAIILAVHQLLPPTDCGIDLSTMAFFPSPNLPPGSTVPPGLCPTPLQLSTPHDVWLDLVPNAKMRDNLLEALRDDKLDAIDLQVDLFGCICSTKLEKQRRLRAEGSRSTSLSVIEREERRCRNLSEDGEIGMLVWSDPWSVEGYEVTEAFLRKWAFILKGCWDLLEATNRWRARRGEDPIYAEL